MFHEFYQHLPLFIDPVIFSIGNFSLRWYSVSYVIGMGVVFLVLSFMIRRGEFEDLFGNKRFRSWRQDKKISLVVDFLMIEFFAVLIGGRLGYVILYNLPYFRQNPLAIIYPFDKSGNFVGLFGMSYFGALIAVILCGYAFSKFNKLNFWVWSDFIAVAVPAGYFFGRVGNFLNGELYGRVTSSALGMYFTADPMNLRHPSQLYEALFEGVILFMILWIIRKRKLFEKGSLFCVYMIGYAVARFFIEFFRQPDFQLGTFVFGLTLNQILSAIVFIVSVVVLFFVRRNNAILNNAKIGKC